VTFSIVALAARLLAMSALALGATPIASTSPEVTASAVAHVHFSLAACSSLAGKHLRSADVSYSFAPITGDGHAAADRTDAAAAIKGTAPWPNPATSPLQFDVTLPPGFYRYAVDDTNGGAPASGGGVVCQYQLYLAALPGKDRTITDTMYNGAGEPITPVLLAGTLPPNVSAFLVRYDGSPACGTPTASLVRHQLLDSQVQSAAYYGYDTKLTAKDGNRGVAFGLELGWPNDERRVLRILADYPKTIVSGAPTFVRFDITPDVEKRALAQPADKLSC
jgi:hypothetical protein